jgi:DNA-binding XRE family transcriptional regulator
MGLQVISKDGEPQYAVLPWAEYQALLQAAGQGAKSPGQTVEPQPVSVDGHANDLPGLDQLGALREAKGLELSQLARTVGISPSYLEMIERGDRRPDAAILRSLAWELGIAGWRGEA